MHMTEKNFKDHSLVIRKDYQAKEKSMIRKEEENDVLINYLYM